MKKPYECKALIQVPHAPTAPLPTPFGDHKINIFETVRNYSFDVNRTEQIFDQLNKDRMIKFPEGHFLPKAEATKGKMYCKYHDSIKHSTKNCVIFRNVI